jgi:hypothetical protein
MQPQTINRQLNYIDFQTCLSLSTGFGASTIPCNFQPKPFFDHFPQTPTTDPVDAMETNTSDPIHNNVDDDDVPSLEEVEDDEEEDEGCEDKDVGEEDDNDNDDNDNDDNDDDEDPFNGLTSEESQELMNDTASVKTALDKVR